MSVLYKLIFLFIFFLFKTNGLSAQSYDSNLSSEKDKKADSLHLDSLI